MALLYVATWKGVELMTIVSEKLFPATRKQLEISLVDCGQLKILCGGKGGTSLPWKSGNVGTQITVC